MKLLRAPGSSLATENKDGQLRPFPSYVGGESLWGGRGQSGQAAAAGGWLWMLENGLIQTDQQWRPGKGWQGLVLPLAQSRSKRISKKNDPPSKHLASQNTPTFLLKDG